MWAKQVAPSQAITTVRDLCRLHFSFRPCLHCYRSHKFPIAYFLHYGKTQTVMLIIASKSSRLHWTHNVLCWPALRSAPGTGGAQSSCVWVAHEGCGLGDLWVATRPSAPAWLRTCSTATMPRAASLHQALCHDVVTLEPVHHGLKPWGKFSLSFKGQVSSTVSGNRKAKQYTFR